jgi:hypothetical protein
MRHILKGRVLWCVTTCSESLSFPNEDNDRIKLQIIDMSIKTLKSEKAKSIKLIATRSLVKFARLMKKE